MTSAMDALGFGANILAFITLTAQLTKLTAQVYGSLADAPDSIQRSLARLDHLERLLIQIDTNIEQHPTLITDQRFRQHWDSRIVAMRLERARLRTFIDGLNAIESAKEKIEWLWTNQKALRAIIQRFCEDVDVLFQHHQILIQTSIHQSLDQIKTTMVTKQEFFQLQGQTLTSVAAPRTSVLIRQRRRKTDGSRSLVSIMGTARTYRLPFGKVRILYGWKCTDSDENGDKLGLLGVWCFEPEPWFSHHNIYTRATVLCRFSKDNSHPSITRTLKTSVIVSDLHPVRQCLENGDIPGFQNLLCIGAVSIYDTFTGGWSLLHSLCEYIVDYSDGAEFFEDERAVNEKQLALLEFILTLDGIDVNAKTGFKNYGPGYSPLSWVGEFIATASSYAGQINSDQAYDPEIHGGNALTSGYQKAIRLLSEHGAELDFSEYILRWAQRDRILGKRGFIDDSTLTGLRKQALDLYSRDLLSLDKNELRVLSASLLEMYFGNLTWLRISWIKARGLPLVDGLPFGDLLEDICSWMAIDSSGPESTGRCDRLVHRAFKLAAESANRITGFDRANNILEFYLQRYPKDGKRIIERTKNLEPGLYGDQSTARIFQKQGMEQEWVEFYAMRMATDIEDWERMVKSGVEKIVLDWLLVYSGRYLEVDHLEFLISKGANLNYSFGEYGQPRTALAGAACSGSTRKILTLIEAGADILLEASSNEGKWDNSMMVDSILHPEIKTMLEKLEVEKRAENGLKKNDFELFELGPNPLIDHTILATGIILTAVPYLWESLTAMILYFWTCVATALNGSVTFVHDSFLGALGFYWRHRRLITVLLGLYYGMAKAFLEGFGWILWAMLIDHGRFMLEESTSSMLGLLAVVWLARDMVVT